MYFVCNFLFPLVFFGFLAGFLGGLLGTGGGILLLFGLRLLFSKKVANGRRFFTTTIAAMLPLSLFSAWQYAQKAPFSGRSVLGLLVPGVLGGCLGAWLLPHLPTRTLGRIFATVVLLSGILTVTI